MATVPQDTDQIVGVYDGVNLDLLLNGEILLTISLTEQNLSVYLNGELLASLSSGSFVIGKNELTNLLVILVDIR